jgi:hypothetical protein
MRIRWAARTSALVGGFAVSAVFAFLAVRHVDWTRVRMSTFRALREQWVAIS